MGWTYPLHTKTRAQLVQWLRRPERFGEHLELVRACASGSHHWYLMRIKETGLHWIGLDLMQGARGEGWGYKDLDESVGPCAHDCPLVYLSAPHEPRDGWALEWRKRVQEHHKTKSMRPQLGPGVRVAVGQGVYTITAPRLSMWTKRRTGWHVSEVNTGAAYYMSAKTAARARIVEGAAV